MPVNILMPALSPTMEKGNLAKWLKKEGDRIKSGDVIAEIETDKATMEVEAVDEGTLAKILVPEGTADVPVNQPIAVLASDGEDVKAAAAGAGRSGLSAKPSSAATVPHPAPSNSAIAEFDESSDRSRKHPTSVAPPSPKGGGISAPAAQPNSSPRSGEGGAAKAAPGGAPPPYAEAHGNDRVFSSPLARRLARESGIDLARVQGSGPHGRVIARDIEAARSGQGLKIPGAPAAGAPLAAQGLSDAQIRALYAENSYDIVPHDNIRKIIAQRLMLSKQTIPHFYLTVDCDIGKLLGARAEINATAPKDKDGNPAYKLSVNDFVIKALALALQRVPDANVTWTETGMLKHRRSDVGVAVAIPGGLITPVVRNAESKSLATLSGEMQDYAARARSRKLKPEEYRGGSTAVSNLGMYGIKDFAAVINPPHATILAIGAGEERAVVRGGKIEAAWMMTVTLSTDHRAVDGALGAQLLGAFKALIENPVMMVV